MVAIAASSRPGNPLAEAIFQSRAAIQTGRHFQTQPGPATRHAGNKTNIDFLRLGGQQATLRDNARCLQTGQALPGHQRIRILHGGHHPPHTRRNQRIGTRRRATVVTARLQRDIGRRSTQCGLTMLRTRGLQGGDLGMMLPCRQSAALADDLPIAPQHAAYARIRARCIERHGRLRQLQGAGHAGVICCGV